MKKYIFYCLLLNLSLNVFSQSIDIDTNYGDNGVTVISSKTTNDPTRSILLADGSLLMSVLKYNETTSSHESVLIKYTSQGVIDTSFGVNGIYTSDIDDDNGLDTFIDSNGNIFLTGQDFNLDKNFIVKITPNGVNDTSFGNNGKKEIDPKYINLRYFFRGDYIYVGVNYSGSSSSDQYGIKRLDLNGDFDTSFGSGGIISIDNFINEFYVTESNEFIVVGSDSSFSTLTISKHNTDGTLDTDFGTNGVLFTGSGDTSGRYFTFNEAENNLFMTIGVIGSSTYSEIYKYDSSGKLDNNFGTSGINTVDNYYLTNLKFFKEKLYVLGIKFDTLDTQILSFNPDDASVNTNFANNGALIETTSFTQFAINLHVKDDYFFITGKNQYASDNVEHYSSKYALTFATASVEDTKSQNIAFENPVKDIVEVKATLSKINRLDIFALNGKLIKSSESNTIRTDELPSNVYILNSYLDNGNVVSNKIIKK
ncbi:T9SS type A sorting domain-containing protein [Tenacibaculum sp. M341]|uniref:T9SS type A sorting domain-containing protein n=1 Tax=Tenacibaculum sp. M341 TaxID=2530339 RepID=UPI0010530071|nr:T9SS type A sorting domain-containing protein [Tenacibaculum sp. M341]TCI93226.1 T9SS type A sorting domain-containing protein [Tenacibaculum sp. M341]